MEFHHHGYVSTDPRVQPARGIGLNRPEELPDEFDVLIVGSGPAGSIAAAQLSQFPEVHTRIIDRNPGRLEIGRADGIQARSVETFKAFGFAESLMEEAHRITEVAFWKPDTENPANITRTARTLEDTKGISEFPHLIINQARVLDYLNQFMANSPTRLKPDYGVEFLGLEITGAGEYPVKVQLRHLLGERAGQERTVRVKYLVGCDGAHSKVRKAIGRRHLGQEANHAWGVIDVLANTDFPDVRLKCAIQSSSCGSILLIPREGGFLVRMYVDLGEASAEVDQVTVNEIVAKAKAILHPYVLDVKNVAWWSVYKVGHRLTDKFDDVPEGLEAERTPRVFLAGDACHTHSAKAGQGMNVSFQDGWNLGWKLGYVVSGRSPERLLTTYSAERQLVARDLIDFDRQWSSLMARRPEKFENPSELEDFYTKTIEFPAGFLTQYHRSIVTGEDAHQDVARGYPIGKRFKSARVSRVCDANPVHLGHLHAADGRWRIYAFADAAQPGGDSALAQWADWLSTAPTSPLVRYTPSDADPDGIFDVKVIYQQLHPDIDINAVPSVFKPMIGPFRLANYNKVFGTLSGEDIFEERGISRSGAVVVVRPDQYVSHVLPLTETAGLASFLEPIMLERAELRPTTRLG